MSLGDLDERLTALTATIQRQGQHLGALRDLVAGQEAAIAELLKRTAPRCEDSLEAVEERLYQPDDGHMRDCTLRRDHAGSCSSTPDRSPQGSPTDPSPSRDLAEHLAASPEAGNGDAPEGFCQCGRRTR